MGTHPIFESDFDCLTDLHVAMVLECVRIRSLPSNVRVSHIESDWSDLNIAEKGILHFQNKFFIFFKNKNEVESGHRLRQTMATLKTLKFPSGKRAMRKQNESLRDGTIRPEAKSREKKSARLEIFWRKPKI